MDQLGYALNQWVALAQFLDDGRLPIHNNHSEQALREAAGRKNWLFIGNDDAGEVAGNIFRRASLNQLRPAGTSHLLPYVG